MDGRSNPRNMAGGQGNKTGLGTPEGAGGSRRGRAASGAAPRCLQAAKNIPGEKMV